MELSQQQGLLLSAVSETLDPGFLLLGARVRNAALASHYYHDGVFLSVCTAGESFMSKLTPTSVPPSLKAHPKKRPTPHDALAMAQEQWLRDQRINMNELAQSLGVNRATLFRWIGNRDIFHAEVIWSLVEPVYEEIRRTTPGEGIDYVCDVLDNIFRLLVESEHLRAYLQADPLFALRILTSKDSPIQDRTISLIASMLEEQIRSGKLQPPFPVDTLAYLLVRLIESFLYGEVISGRQPDWAAAMKAIRLLTTGHLPSSGV